MYHNDYSVSNNIFKKKTRKYRCNTTDKQAQIMMKMITIINKERRKSGKLCMLKFTLFVSILK